MSSSKAHPLAAGSAANSAPHYPRLLTHILLLILIVFVMMGGGNQFPPGASDVFSGCAEDHAATFTSSLIPLPLQNGVNTSTRPQTDIRQFRVFIVVYKQHDRVRKLVKELLMSDLTSFTFEIIVLNNFGTFVFPQDDPLFEANSNNLTVINNYARPEFSYGHLARDWNTAALYGFVDLADPISEVVVGLQGDVSLVPEWAANVYREHTTEGTLFLQFGHGDAFHSWTAEGVRRIGLWDERFMGVGYQEGDMFLRAVILEPERVSINDPHHKRVHRPASFDTVLDSGPGDHSGIKHRHRHSVSFWKEKWGDRESTSWNTVDENWMLGVAPYLPSTYLYPYFEWKLDGPVERLWYPYAVDLS